jgi:galactoside O-acetyltransferase
MTEYEKAQAGYLYDANYDEALIKAREKAQDLCFDYNNLRPSDPKRKTLLRELMPNTKEDSVLLSPLQCDYGFNVYTGKSFFANYNTVLLDAAPITFGDYVFIAPNCVFTTSGHPIDEVQRNQGLEIAWPITVGNSVWFGAGVIVAPGVTIGDHVVIGAGSVVTKDIPSNVVAVGAPCHVVRTITEADKHKYKLYKETKTQ